MNHQQSELYHGIQKYIESHEDLQRKLAIDYKWDDQFTQGVVQEYCKFIFLAVSVNHTVVPSQHVDKVWHGHLLFTKEYWQDFCRKLLAKDLHHTPGNGREKERLKKSYIETLASYESLFEQKPPTDIWPELPNQLNSCIACAGEVSA